MKVLMYGWEFPPLFSGGLGIACYNIVKELAIKNIKISLVLPKAVQNIDNNKNIKIIGCNSFNLQTSLSSFEKFKELINIEVIDSLLHPYLTENSYTEDFINSFDIKNNVNFSKLLSVKLTGKYGPDLLSEVFRYSLVAGALAKNIDHDIIHAHDWLTILAGIEAKKYSKKPLVFHVHALEFDRSGQNVNQKIFDLEKYGLENADKIVSVSQYTKNMIINNYGISQDKIEVIHNGISSDFIPCKKHNIKMVLFVGRITYQKGPWFFIEIAKKILSKRKDVQFVIAGGGDLLPDMIEKVAEYSIGKNVHFTGFLDQASIDKIYKLADVYVMTSISEPFGLSCLEALSRKVPAVISKQSGVSEVLEHVLKADFWDTDNMAEKILSLLDYKALRNEMISNSYEETKKITWKNTANKLIDLYYSLT